MKALENLQINRLLPDGKEAYISEGNVFGNSMAFRDVDADGRKELILNIAGTCIGDMGLYVYQLDEDNNVNDAINAAGGFTSKAYKNNINFS